MKCRKYCGTFTFTIMRKTILFLAIPILLASCAGNQKKLLVLSHNGPAIDPDNKTIVCKSTTGHEEKELDLSGNVSFKISTAAGDATLNMPEKGYYIMNLKNNDTIIGAYQNLVSADKGGTFITQVDLKKKIDSLQLLLEGKNVSDANRNFYILPNTVVKITSNPDAKIVAPYHPMTSFQPGDDGEAPEVYQFFTIKELRELLENLIKHTKAEVPPPPAKK